ncbi:MAG: NAD(P)-dependent oxidoreductase [Caldilineales bacterium]|nr:NAD(P)-dependent oxidoreductase [Caldilineales bacterium]MCW5857954.1 NAD(P)-dependent oxidoreductase [Caldilineales bacterium]
MTVGFIGLGIMGGGMAANLLNKGFDLVVYNRTRAKAEALIAAGASWADTPAELARRADTVITMLAHPEAVSEAAGGENGFLDQMEPGGLWIDCSTVNPSFTRDMAAYAQELELRFVDAPVTGSKAAAAAGALRFLVGAEPDDLALARPLLEAMGTQIIHVGGVGMGSAAKIVNNLVLAEMMTAFAEGLVLGEALGIERGRLLDLLIEGPGGAPIFRLKRARLATGDFSHPDFSLRWLQKDVHLAAQTAYELGVALPVGNTTKETLALAMRYGLGDEDFSAIYRFLAG